MSVANEIERISGNIAAAYAAAGAMGATMPDVQNSANLAATINTVQGGGGGAVTSVNGQVGDVVLDADDVGAIPNEAGAVGTEQLADYNITSIKLADQSVTAEKLADGAVTPESIGAASLDANGKVKAEQACAAVVIHTGLTEYTLTADDMGKFHRFGISTGATATLTITVPNDSNIPLGSEIEILKLNGGLAVNFVGSSVNFCSKDSTSLTSFSIDGYYGLVALKKIGGSTWLIRGDIA
jgi:hypothetical protein